MVNLDSTAPVAATALPAPSPGPDPRGPAAAAGAAEAPWPRSFTERFAQLAALSPDAPAIGTAAGTLTYGQAQAQVEAVARGLHARPGLRADAPVGVLVGAGADSLTALLAVARTGRPAVPLDTQLPVARLREIAQLAGLGVCVSEVPGLALAQELMGSASDVAGTGELLEEGLRRDGEPLPAPGRGGDPLFVVFTSGSTGRPKGVLMTHDQLLSGAATARDRFAVGAGDRVALVLPPSFAAGAVVLSTALLNGACAWSFDPRRHGARAVAEVVEAQGLTVLCATPHLLRSVLATLAPGRLLTSLRLVATAGEAVFGRDVEQLAAHVRPGTDFWNWPGSSETGPLAGFRVVCGGPVPEGPVPAGVPEDGKEVRVLAPDGTPVAPGEPGEVFVTAAHLAAGYLGDPERTAERFTEEPDGRRTYRMGDLGRFDAAGDLHLLGRVDGAVKVRGYFVHLTEVEGAVLASPAVAEAVVVAVQAGGTHRLVAYVAPEPGSPTESPAALRRRLRARLPEYMVPGDVVPVSALPRNERGKVDRAQLPPVPPRAPAEPPAGATEVALARTWAELLGLSGPVPVGADDDFQQLGADSLTVEEMLTRVEDGFGVALRAGDLLAAPTLREFARRVEAGAGALPRHPTAVALRSGAGAPALFCFAGAGALAMSFKSLAAHVDDRPVVAFHARGAESRALPDRSVRAAALRHLRDLRLVQPRGPYVLVGHSMGGLIALEVAQLLTDAGEEVASVVLVDTYLPRTRRPDPAAAADGGPGAPPGPAGPLGAGLRLLRTGAHRLLPDGLPPLHLVPQRLRVPLAGLVPFGEHQSQVFHDHGQVVARRHRVRPYAGRTVCVQLRDNPDGREPWEELLTGPHEFLDIDCDHNSVLREPRATELAAAVLRELRAVRR